MSGAELDRASRARSSPPSATFVDRTSIPVASELEHADEFPTALVETMREMGLFGTTIPEEYGGLGLGLDTYALILMELSRGWVTLSGIINGSFIAATMIRLHGTDEQRRRLPAPARVGRDPRGVLDDRAPRGLGRPGDPHDGDARRRRLRPRRPEDVGDERLARGADRRAREDRPDDRSAAPRHDRASSSRRSPTASLPGLTIPMPALKQARLQGRRVDRAGVRRLPHARVERARRGGGRRAGIQVLHERDRGRAASTSPPAASASRRPRSTTPSATRRSARHSASRSAATRRSS